MEFKTYVDGLNKILEDNPELANCETVTSSDYKCDYKALPLENVFIHEDGIAYNLETADQYYEVGKNV